MMSPWEQTRVQWWGSAFCLAVAGLLGVWSVAKLAIWATGGEPVAASVASRGEGPAMPAVAELMSGYKERAELLKKEGHFKPKPGPPPKPKRCMGIVGDRAFIDGKWVKVGDKVGPAAEVLAIEATFVKLRWREEEIILAPIKAAGGGGRSKRGHGRPRRPPKRPTMRPGPVPAEPPQPAVVAAPSGEDPFAWLGVALTAEQRAKFLRIWNTMSDEHKDKAKEEWGRMSSEEKKKAIESLSRVPMD